MIAEIDGRKYVRIELYNVALFLVSLAFLAAIVSIAIYLFKNPELYRCYCAPLSNNNLSFTGLNLTITN